MNKNILLVLLLVGGVAYYSYDQLWPSYQEAERQIAELRTKIEEAHKNAPELAKIKLEEEDLQKKLNATLTKLPTEQEVINLLDLVTPIFDKVGISSDQIKSKRVDNPSVQEIYKTYPVFISGITGVSWQTMLQLLFELRTFDRILNVKSVGLLRQPDEKFTLDLIMETYSYIDMEPEKPLANEKPAAGETVQGPAK